MKVDLLRLFLSPVSSGLETARCGYRVGNGPWHPVPPQPLAEIAQQYSAKRVEACLHPEDVVMATVPMPPLPKGRRQAAVLALIEPLALVPVDALVVAHGTRGDDGQVPVAWVRRETLETIGQRLQRDRLPVRGLYPPTAFLPWMPDGWRGRRIDGWALLRTGRDRGLSWLITEGAQTVGELDGLPQQAPGTVEWLDMEAGSTPPESGAAAWSGEEWPWSLPIHGLVHGVQRPTWRRPVLAWGIAASVWLAGLGLYAGQLKAEGEALRRQMVAQVKAAFPALPVVIEPLHQARQQLEASQQAPDPSTLEHTDFDQILRLASMLPLHADGQVQRLRYRDGTLHLGWREGASLSAAEIEALQAQARERGLAATSSASGLQLQPGTSPPASPGASPDAGADP